MHLNHVFFPEFLPAEVKIGKICRVVYHAKHPQTGEMKRFVIKCNKAKDAKTRNQIAKKICKEVNDKLSDGWNPFIEREGEKAYKTIYEAAETFLKDKKKELRPDGYRSYNSLTKIFLKWVADTKPIAPFACLLNRADAINFLDSVYTNKNISGRTYNNYLRFFKTLWNWMIEKGYCKENIFIDIKKKRVEETEKVLIDKSLRLKINKHLIESGDHDFLTICMLCFQCFLRDKEICMLKVKDIDIDNNILTVRSSVSKTLKTRTIGIPDNLRTYFLKLNFSNLDDFIFSTYFKQRKVQKNTRDIGKRWEKLRNELNLPPTIKFYSLKHTGITEMLESGVPAKYVQELAGHHSLEMTEKYKKKSTAHEILKHNTLSF